MSNFLEAAVYAHVTSLPQLAYMLATAEHELGMGSNMDEDYNDRPASH